VALGAVGGDLAYFSKKLESAYGFYNAMDTPQERSGYAGSKDSFIARGWLGQFGNTIATVGQVDAVLAEIVGTI